MNINQLIEIVKRKQNNIYDIVQKVIVKHENQSKSEK